MITDLFRLSYSEPKSVKIFRRLIIVISVGISIAIFIILCIGIHDELPSINVFYRASNKLPTPRNYNCNNAISKATYNTSHSKYLVAFSSSYAITSRIVCTLSINITDPRYNVSNQTDYMEMYAYDKEYDLNKIPLSGQEIQFEESLPLKNMYFFGQPRNDIAHYEWTFDRCIRHALISDFLNYFGRQSYISIPYIDSHMSTVSTANSDLRINNSYYAVLQFITSPPFIVTEETEQRSKTVLNVLGVIGGIWSFVVAFYIFLFGPGLISPWGFVQSKLFKSRYKKDVLPFVYEPDTADDFNTSIQKRLNNLEKRIEFYDRFIFDDPLLNFIKQESQPEKHTTEK
ncbi:941_t:CDS:2 [Gigaspora rosea]|nr:941_t:CDS:2 [Gigaspora rosea]